MKTDQANQLLLRPSLEEQSLPQGGAGYLNIPAEATRESLPAAFENWRCSLDLMIEITVPRAVSSTYIASIRNIIWVFVDGAENEVKNRTEVRKRSEGSYAEVKFETKWPIVRRSEIRSEKWTIISEG